MLPCLIIEGFIVIFFVGCVLYCLHDRHSKRVERKAIQRRLAMTKKYMKKKEMAIQMEEGQFRWKKFSNNKGVKPRRRRFTV